jgi:hypothetical protein
MFVTRIRSPSNAAWLGEFSPLAVSFAKTIPSRDRTTVSEFAKRLGTRYSRHQTRRVRRWGCHGLENAAV